MVNAPGADGSKSFRIMWMWVRVLGCLLAAIGLAAMANAGIAMGDVSGKLALDDARTLLTLLAFVVALASYLAGMTRDMAKAAGALSEGTEKTQRLDALAWVTTADVLLITLGLSLIARLALARVGRTPAELTIQADRDMFLISWLAVILIYLALAHAAQWVRIGYLWNPFTRD